MILFAKKNKLEKCRILKSQQKNSFEKFVGMLLKIQQKTNHFQNYILSNINLVVTNEEHTNTCAIGDI